MRRALMVLALCGVAAFAHEGHQTVPEGQAVPPPGGAGTRDAQSYFTDTLLLTQEGREVRFYNDVLKDRVVLLNVVFTSCTDACPLITRKLREVRAALGEERASRITFVSLTSDPLNDTPEKLRDFIHQQGVEAPNWLFLTGDKANVDLVLARLGQLSASPEQHSTLLIAGDVAGRRWSRISPSAPVAAIAERLQLLSMPR